MNEEECVNPTPCPSTPKPILDFTDPAPASELKWDWETVCLSNDGGVTKLPGIAVYSMLDPQNPSSTLYIGTTDVTATHTIVSCDLDRETVESCYQLISDPSVRFKRINILDVSVTPAVVIETIWLDDNGDSVAAPAGVEPCSDPVKSVESVCDVVDTTVTGNIPYTLTTNDVAIAYTPSVVLTGDTALFYWTDFGDGYNDVGNAPSHTYTADGSYEIKSYVVTSSGNKILLAAKEIVITAGVVTIATANPQTVNRVYKVSVGSAMQEYSGTTPVGVPVNPDGTPYTVVGNLAWECPKIIDELEDNAEWNPETKADLVDCTTVEGANIVSEGVNANINASVGPLGPPSTTVFHTLLGNTLAMNGSGLNVMSAGLDVNVQEPLITGAQFTYNINLIGDADIDTQDLAIVIWDNNANTSVTATSIVASAGLTFGVDLQGTGLNYPIYGYTGLGAHTITWTGDLPQGSYSVVLTNQDQSALDQIELSVTHNIIEGGTTVTTKAQLTALDQCTIDALTPTPVVDPILVPGGAIIVNAAALSVIAPANTRSFSVKPLIIDSNATALTVTPLYDISFDNGTTWLLNIDGGDTNGEGNRYQIDVSQVQIRPSSIVPNQRVYIKWDRV